MNDLLALVGVGVVMATAGWLTLIASLDVSSETASDGLQIAGWVLMIAGVVVTSVGIWAVV